MQTDLLEESGCEEDRPNNEPNIPVRIGKLNSQLCFREKWETMRQPFLGCAMLTEGKSTSHFHREFAFGALSWISQEGIRAYFLSIISPIEPKHCEIKSEIIQQTNNLRISLKKFIHIPSI